MISGETTPHSSEIRNAAILSPGGYASDGTIALHPIGAIEKPSEPEKTLAAEYFEAAPDSAVGMRDAGIQ